jgi:hypothetical protein
VRSSNTMRFLLAFMIVAKSAALFAAWKLRH